MINFIVNDMTCGHCENVVSSAIKTVDPDAIVNIDIKTQRVKVESDLGADELMEIIKDAGYTASVASEIR